MGLESSSSGSVRAFVSRRVESLSGTSTGAAVGFLKDFNFFFFSDQRSRFTEKEMC